MSNQTLKTKVTAWHEVKNHDDADNAEDVANEPKRANKVWLNDERGSFYIEEICYLRTCCKINNFKTFLHAAILQAKLTILNISTCSNPSILKAKLTILKTFLHAAILQSFEQK